MCLQTPSVCAAVEHTPDCLADITLPTCGPPIDPQLCFYLQK